MTKSHSSSVLTIRQRFCILMHMSLPDVRTEYIELQNASGNIIHGDFRYMKSETPLPLIIICHSFMAFKDWGFFPYLGTQLAGAGFCTFTFNYSLDGAPGNNRITDIEKFARNTFSQELQDLGSVFGAFYAGKVGRGIVDPDRIVLLGHSRGGGTAIVYTGNNSRVRALITLSAISTFDRWTVHQKKEWRAKGYLPLAKETSASPLRLGIELLQDIEQHHDKLDILRATERVHVPWLLIHGAADVTVPPREAETLYAHANKTSTEFLLLEKTGHLFHASTKEEDQYETLNHTISLITTWLSRTI